MVQFSDIIGKSFEKKPKAPASTSGDKGGKQSPGNLQFSGKADLMGHSDLIAAEREKAHVKKYYDALFEKAVEVEERVKNNQGLAPSPVLSILHRIIEESHVASLYAYATSALRDDEFPSHSIAVTFGALKVARGLGYDTEMLLKLGLAAFFENVGMYKIPEHVLQKKGRLSHEEMDVIRKHPEHSAQILGRMGEAFQWLQKIALQIHERSDGSGYPRGLKGEEISEAASIIGLMDVYMAMIKNRPYRSKVVQTEAIKSIIDIAKSKFPTRVLKAFLNQISLFPVNTLVKLNNKSIGRVLSTNKSRPLRPVIRILYDGLGQEMEKGKVVDLSNFPLLHIVSTIDEGELP